MSLPMPPDDRLTDREMRMMDSLLTIPRRKMPLSLFEKEYLPFLSSVPVPKEVVEAMLARMSRITNQPHTVQDLTGNLLNQWMEYHQSPGAVYMMVDIMHEEQVVYTVPPLLENRNVLVDGVDNQLLHQLTNHSANLATVYAGLADKFVKDELLPLIVPGNINPEHVEMWNRIYDYHNLPRITIGENGIQSTAATANTQRIVANGVTKEADGSISDLDEYD